MSEDQLQPQDTLDDRGVDDILDEGISPPEHLRGSNAKGVTARPRRWRARPSTTGSARRSRRSGRRPRPSPRPRRSTAALGAEVGDERTGRLMATDDTTDAYAEDEGIDGAGASAEEAAVHTIEE